MRAVTYVHQGFGPFHWMLQMNHKPCFSGNDKPLCKKIRICISSALQYMTAGAISLLSCLRLHLVFLVADYVWRSNDPHTSTQRISLGPPSYVVGGYGCVHSRNMLLGLSLGRAMLTLNSA